MNKVLDKKQAIIRVIWIVAIAIIISLWPLRLVNEVIVSKSNKIACAKSEALTDAYPVKQMFIAQYDRLKNIKIYFCDGEVGEEFNFILFDASMNMLMQQVISTKGMMEEIPGYCTIQVNIDTEVGREYYYLLQGIEGEKPYTVCYEEDETSGNIYNGTLYYGNVEDTEHSIIAEYEYKVPLRKGRTLMCDALFVLLAVVLTRITKKYYDKKPQKNTLLTTEMVIKRSLNPLIAVATVGMLLAIWPGRFFSKDAVCNITYALSVLLLAVIAFYAVNHDRTGIATSEGPVGFLSRKWQDYLQSAMFAGAIWACCNYMNGLYEIHHDVAYRQMLIFFALAVIVTYKKKELFNIVTILYAVAAAVIGPMYYSNAVAALEKQGELEILVVKLTTWTGILVGFIAIGLVRKLITGKYGRISIWYGLFVAAFFTLIIVYRNMRGWPIYLVCAFTVFYVSMAAWEKKTNLAANICNGILVHFVWAVCYCLAHRPYMFYRYYRYPFVFHTVTVSAVYLALVLCAALVKFMDKYKRYPNLKGTYKELILLGVSASYLLMTLSRTGFLAVFAVGVIVIPLCLFAKRKMKLFFKALGMMCLACVVCLPVTFTAQRCVPAVYAEPILMEIEELPSEIVHGRDMDSYYYITVQRFVQVFQMKVLGMPEEKCVDSHYIVADAKDNGFLQILEKPILLASSQDMAAGGGESDSPAQDGYDNGRMDIFRLYYNNLNKVGHEDMGIMLPNGVLIAHAHNIYLQVAYDHGIYVGIAFLIFGIATFVSAVLYYVKRREDVPCAALPLTLLILFAVAGLTEWIFHPCSPIAYCLLLTLAPLLVDSRRTL